MAKKGFNKLKRHKQNARNKKNRRSSIDSLLIGSAIALAAKTLLPLFAAITVKTENDNVQPPDEDAEFEIITDKKLLPSPKPINDATGNQ